MGQGLKTWQGHWLMALVKRRCTDKYTHTLAKTVYSSNGEGKGGGGGGGGDPTVRPGPAHAIFFPLTFPISQEECRRDS